MCHRTLRNKETPLYDVNVPLVLAEFDGDQDTVQIKEFKITLWRINKFLESRHVLAQ